jgi:hypothetical protein
MHLFSVEGSNFPVQSAQAHVEFGVQGLHPGHRAVAGGRGGGVRAPRDLVREGVPLQRHFGVGPFRIRAVFEALLDVFKVAFVRLAVALLHRNEHHGDGGVQYSRGVESEKSVHAARALQGALVLQFA